MLYMFVFSLPAVFQNSATRFSRGNMQVAAAEVLDGNESFRSLDFAKIYHEGAYGPGDEDIRVWRCAEVLVPGSLPLDGTLEAVHCRSDAERRTLIHKLGQLSEEWSKRIVIADAPAYFNSEYAYCESVDIDTNGVRIKFHPRKFPPNDAKVKVDIWRLFGERDGYSFFNNELDIRKSWKFKVELEPGPYLVRCWIDDELAYEAELENSVDPF
jgi:hypothetical protein